jgi:ribosomal protein S18 acetylase RimI-like enzyme
MQLTANAAETVIDASLERIDFARVHGWLSNTYWSPGVSREKVERAARNTALVIGAYRDGVQVGYLRVVSDKTTFAYIADVYVDEAYRGKGIARAMVRYALDHPEYQGLRRWMLATRDAHDVYRGLGFEAVPNPERWMTYIPEQQG